MLWHVADVPNMEHIPLQPTIFGQAPEGKSLRIGHDARGRVQDRGQHHA